MGGFLAPREGKHALPLSRAPQNKFVPLSHFFILKLLRKCIIICFVWICDEKERNLILSVLLWPNIFLWHNILLMVENFFCDRIFFLWQNGVSLMETQTENCFYDTNLFGRGPFFSGIFLLSERYLFLWDWIFFRKDLFFFEMGVFFILDN